MLQQILAHKRAEISGLQRQHRDWAPPAMPPKRRDFAAALRAPGISLIAEFKRRSPSRGEISRTARPAETARSYEAAGAAALSVLTDGEFFGGSLDDLRAARGATGLPTLRKDFIIDPCQVADSAGTDGPDCLLLIAAALETEALRELIALAARCGQAALVEVHDEADLEQALAAGAAIIGINNRDLRTFEVTLDTTVRLRPRLPEGRLVVAESGVHTRDDILRLTEVGIDGVLVGEALMAAESPERKLAELLGRA